MSAQKFPMVPVDRRAKARANAAITAMPVAAETKFCTASPSIWVR
jgi:hypothetical protein